MDKQQFFDELKSRSFLEMDKDKTFFLFKIEGRNYYLGLRSNKFYISSVPDKTPVDLPYMNYENYQDALEKIDQCLQFLKAVIYGVQNH